MRVFKPSYYDSFKCIAGKCKHNCCIGWEIDVDEDTMDLYMAEGGSFGERLKENISLEGDCPHFILGSNERCPFLNKDNLCDIIINMGEDSLCQICNDHPRFVNCIEDREEIGIGMCCEEAARIIVTYTDKVEIIGEKSDDEEMVFALRDMVIEMLQNRDKSIEKRISEVLKTFKLRLVGKDWVTIFENLERLDERWTRRLKSLRREGKELEEDWSVPFEQILVYFIYRYMAEGLYDKRYNERILFSVLSFYMIRELFKRYDETMEELVEICRMYSSEIEYSEENVEILMKYLKMDM